MDLSVHNSPMEAQGLVAAPDVLFGMVLFAFSGRIVGAFAGLAASSPQGRAFGAPRPPWCVCVFEQFSYTPARSCSGKQNQV